MRREQTTPRGFQTDGGDNAASSSAQDPRYPRCKVIVAPRTSACASCDLIVTDCLSPRVTKFRLAVNVGPLATTRKPTPSTLPDRVPAALRVNSLQVPVIAPLPSPLILSLSHYLQLTLLLLLSHIIPSSPFHPLAPAMGQIDGPGAGPAPRQLAEGAVVRSRPLGGSALRVAVPTAKNKNRQRQSGHAKHHARKV